MKLFLVTFAIILVGCTSHVPPQLESIKQDVDSRVSYKHYYAKDYQYVAGIGEGNCTTFTETYHMEASKLGIKGHNMTCFLMSGEPHAYFLTLDGWVLDNRLSYVGRFEDVGCIVPK